MKDTLRIFKRLASVRRELAAGLPIHRSAPVGSTLCLLMEATEIERLLGHATLQEKKKWIRTMVQEIKLAPEEQEITITYYPPRLFVDNELAGTYDDVMHEVFSNRLVRTISLPRRGRRKRSSTSFPTVATA